MPPIALRPHLDPVHDEAVAAAPPQCARGEEGEIRKRRDVHDVVLGAVPPEVASERRPNRTGGRSVRRSSPYTRPAAVTPMTRTWVESGGLSASQCRIVTWVTSLPAPAGGARGRASITRPRRPSPGRGGRRSGTRGARRPPVRRRRVAPIRSLPQRGQRAHPPLQPDREALVAQPELEAGELRRARRRPRTGSSGAGRSSRASASSPLA